MNLFYRTFFAAGKIQSSFFSISAALHKLKFVAEILKNIQSFYSYEKKLQRSNIVLGAWIGSVIEVSPFMLSSFYLNDFAVKIKL